MRVNMHSIMSIISREQHHDAAASAGCLADHWTWPDDTCAGLLTTIPMDKCTQKNQAESENRRTDILYTHRGLRKLSTESINSDSLQKV